jgi:probable F420-dependent oxidoreductase
MRFMTDLPGLMHYPPGFSPEWTRSLSAADFQRLARAADELGYDAINVPEHIVMPDELAPFMGDFWPHAFTAMAFIAGATTRIQVNSCVIVLPYHQPLQLAKAVSTLDLLSGGRVMLTFGIGHAEGEFRALGIPFERRGQIANEYLEAMHILWTEEEPSFAGEFVSFSGVRFAPKPATLPRIWIGGNSAPALRRAARYGNGWMPWLVTNEELPARLEELRAQPGFDDVADDFDLFMAPAPMRVREEDHSLLDDGGPVHIFDSDEAVIDAIGELVDLGVNWTHIPRPGGPARSMAEHLEHLAWGAEQVIPRFAPSSRPL